MKERCKKQQKKNKQRLLLNKRILLSDIQSEALDIIQDLTQMEKSICQFNFQAEFSTEIFEGWLKGFSNNN